MDHGRDVCRDAPLYGKLPLAVITAVSVHHGLFVHGEWHLQSPAILFYHLLALFLYTAFLITVEQCATIPALMAATSVFGAYLTALLTSIAVYRVLFHRLSRAGFPGPPLARISKFWHVWACSDSKNHLVLDRLAQQYGDFVRTGKMPDFQAARLVWRSS